MPTVDRMNQDYCSRVYDEAKRIADDGFPEHQRDLFTEQGAFFILFYVICRSRQQENNNRLQIKHSMLYFVTVVAVA